MGRPCPGFAEPPDMVPALLMTLGAIAMPLFSKRWPWFLAWSAGAVAVLVVGYRICMSVEQGWDELACVVLGFFGIFPVAASIAFGFARAMMTAGGTRRADRKKLVVAGVAIYGIAALAAVVIGATG